MTRNYIIESQVDCDPRTERCFVHHCDPTNEECTSDSFTDTSYYKIVQKKAADIESCGDDADCSQVTCSQEDSSCQYKYCMKDNPDLQECSEPTELEDTNVGVKGP